MERREGARDPERAGRFVAAYFAAPPGDVEIKTPPDGVTERGDGRDLALEVRTCHAPNL